MDRSTGDAVAFQLLSELVAHPLRATKHQGLGVQIGAVGHPGLLQDLVEDLVLVVAGARLDHLNDVLVPLELVPVADLDLKGFPEEFRGQAPDPGRPRRGEEESVPLPRHLVQDLPDLRLEAHVKHAVCLVEDKDIGGVHGNDATVYEVLETTWRRHHDVGALSDLIHLLLGVSLSAMDQADAVCCTMAELLRLLKDLHAELPRRGEDQGVRLAFAFIGHL
mmetsp:Transcript_121884/g.272138  ORF Transcript_121884/g.272138 Transcript_121884/m.272138 type:complete len:221 (-) Transcript_121884:841-1503(-)